MGVTGEPSRVQSSSSNTNSNLPYNMEHPHSSPIDNVPFTTIYNNNTTNDTTNTDINKCFQTIDRIQQYLSTPSQSEYSFNLENSILSESLLS